MPVIAILGCMAWPLKFLILPLALVGIAGSLIATVAGWVVDRLDLCAHRWTVHARRKRTGAQRPRGD